VVLVFQLNPDDRALSSKSYAGNQPPESSEVGFILKLSIKTKGGIKTFSVKRGLKMLASYPQSLHDLLSQNIKKGDIGSVRGTQNRQRMKESQDNGGKKCLG
jgi:hypothetical protein